MANFEEFKDKALAAMGTIINKSSELYETAEEKAKLLAKTTKLKAEIAKDNADRKKLYADLGSLYYCIHKDDPEDGLAQICAEIKLLADKIEIKQHELETLKKEAEAADIEVDITTDDCCCEFEEETTEETKASSDED